MSQRAPWRSIQRPTGSAASALTPMPTEKAPVTSTRDQPRSASMGRSSTGKP
jgi:hypothetical protein